MKEAKKGPKKEKEVWKNIEVAPGYQVSNRGRIRSRWRTIFNGGRRQTRKPQFLKPANEDGYDYVNLSLKGKSKKFYVHQLVAIAFLGPMPPDKEEIDHINRVRDDNRPENLRYVTKKEQAANRVLNPVRGSANKRAALNEKDIREIRARHSKGEKAAQIHKDFKDRVGLDAISKILNRKTWKHVK